MSQTQTIGPAVPGNRIAKSTAFLFGAVAYLTFLFTILYAIGFVSGLVVPKDMQARNHRYLKQSSSIWR